MSDKGQTQQSKTPTPQPAVSQPADPQPQTATPALAAAGLQAMLAGRPGEPRPEQLLALQRTVGNVAVQRLIDVRRPPGDLQRGEEDDQEPAGGLNASMIGFEGAAVQLSGVVQARPGSAPGTVDILAPRVHFSARVWLMEGVSLDGGAIMVGPVQTLAGSERIGVYRQGGNPRGQILLEHHVQTPTVRDAMYREGEGGRREAIVEEPWYSAPVRVSGVHTGRDPARPNTVEFEDQPGFTLELQMAGGTLTQTRGQDRFVTSLAAQRDGALVHLTSQEWQIPWELAIDAQGRGRGQSPSGGPSEQTPSATTGEIAVNRRTEWLSFTSVEAAMGAHANTLFFHLQRTRQHDRQSWQYMVEALRRKNPTIQISVGVRRPADPDIPLHQEADEIMLRVSAAGQAERDLGQLAAGQSRTAQVRLLEAIPDPATITGGTAITFRVWDAGLLSHAAATVRWTAPFDPQRELTAMSGGQGSYHIGYEFLDASVGGAS